MISSSSTAVVPSALTFAAKKARQKIIVLEKEDIYRKHPAAAVDVSSNEEDLNWRVAVNSVDEQKKIFPMNSMGSLEFTSKNEEDSYDYSESLPSMCVKIPATVSHDYLGEENEVNSWDLVAFKNKKADISQETPVCDHLQGPTDAGTVVVEDGEEPKSEAETALQNPSMVYVSQLKSNDQVPAAVIELASSAPLLHDECTLMFKAMFQ